MPLELDQIEDFATDAADAIARYKFDCILPKPQLLADAFALPGLNWNAIPYGPDHIDNVPNDRRGIYAFAVCRDGPVLPPHCYVLYVGIAGRGNSNRSLRQRYRDYLNNRKILERARVARMIGTWHPVLKFYYAPVENDVTSDQLEELEEQISGALMPWASRGDLKAKLKAQRRAFT